MKLPLPNQIYKHYTHKFYKIITTARSTDNPNNVYVIYEAQYKDEIFGNKCKWSREVNEFMEDIIVKGKIIKRFTLHE
jgi:hypothetical protein